MLTDFRGQQWKAITIPGSVKTIGERAFMHCSELESINIGGSVNEIGSFLFNGCDKLTSIIVDADNNEFDSRDNCNAIIKTSTNKLIEGCQSTIIPNTVETIGTHAFHGCRYLESIAIPKSVLNIEYQAFGYCRNLKSISISSGVSNIESNPFIGCSSLKSITVDKDNQYYDSRNGCNAIVKSDNNELIVGCQNTSIENTIENIGYGAFGGCTGLSSIIIPNSVKNIKGGAFSGCSNMTKVDIPNSVKAIYSYAFENCSNLTSVTIPNTLKLIELGLFKGCEKLSKIEIPETVEVIEKYAFMGCSSLTSLTIPGNVEEIWERAFEGCEALTEVYSFIRKPFKIPSDCWNKVKTGTIPLYVLAGTKALYEATDGWKEFKNIVEMVNIDPIEGETTVNTANLISQDLSDNVVDDVYYNTGDGSYDATDGSIVINETTNMGQITNAVPGSDDVKNNFTGIKGTITVNVKTIGNAQLVVQVGNATPMIASKTEQGDVVVSYDVEEDTYVYIYAIIGSSASPSMRASSTDEVRIYGFTVSPGASGVKAVWANEDSKAQIFSLDGKPLNEPQKGVNIVRMSNGQVRKVVVK